MTTGDRPEKGENGVEFADVQETKEVRWRVKSVDNPNSLPLELEVNDILVFVGTSTTKSITRQHKNESDNINWATGCTFQSVGQDGKVDGKYQGFPNWPLSIDFRSRITTDLKAEHTGTVTFLSGVPDGKTGTATWMADEGP